MFEYIIRFSVQYKFIVFLLVAGIIGLGIYSMNQIPLDAVPDITNNQVQIVTVSPSLAPQEVEQLITFPVEVAVANIPDVTEIRSISRYGLSVVTVVFKDHVAVLDARQFVKEQIALAEGEIPDGLGMPELMPITTGLGEIYQYTLDVDSGYEAYYDAMRLRTIQDWIVKRQLSGIPGIIEVSSFGGYLKQYEVAINPMRLRSLGLSVQDVYEALSANNQNSGGSYIEKNTNAYYIRTEGRITSLDEIKNIVIKNNEGTPVRIQHVAEVKWGSPKRYGAMTRDGKGEAVGGITLMFKGANSSEAINNVKERIRQVEKSLPPGVHIAPYLDRSELVGKTITTVSYNLLEGGLIVIFVLILLLGNWRAGLVVASVIPLSMLFAFILMNYTGVSANLMSLGAIDFGIVVDGAVIIVESILHTIYTTQLGKKLSQPQMDNIIADSSAKIYKSAAFGVFIILVVFLPIITLTGIEGKTFRPMALTVSYAILGAMILSMTYVPVVSSLLMSKNIKSHFTVSDRIMNAIRKMYLPVLERSLKLPKLVLGLSIGLFLSTIVVFSQMGAEFIPTLEEGDLAMQMTIQPGSSLEESIKTSTRAEQILLDKFPEIKHVVSKIGTAEVPTDPMAIEDADIMIVMKEKDEWTSAQTREDLVAMMKQELEVIIGATFEFTQPIQLRFNELMTGAKTDIAIKIFGEDLDELVRLGNNTADIIGKIEGAGDVKVEQTDGLPQLVIKMNRDQLARYHVDVDDVNQAVRMAYAGEVAGVVFEGEKKFDLVIRLLPAYREGLDLSQLFIPLENGNMVPLGDLVTTELVEGPMQISREDAKRRIVIGVNVRNRDVASLVNDIQTQLNSRLALPPGYYITYGGQFENLQAAQQRLIIAVPIALLLIFLFLYTAFRSLKYSALIFTAVPLSAIGGIIALWSRGMPFSISAGVGFIALFGVAVLNGIVLISHLNELRESGEFTLGDLIIRGSLARLRPVLMTAAVAAFGFLPMALSTSAGAEVQKPLATVVVGGLISSTLLTLVVLPVIYLISNRSYSFTVSPKLLVLVIGMLGLSVPSLSQTTLSQPDAIQRALSENLELKQAELSLEQSRLSIRKAYDPGDLSLDYQRGNINSQFVDYWWEANQSLGNPLEVLRAKDVAMASYHAKEAAYLLLKKHVIHEVKQAWNIWYFESKRLGAIEAAIPATETLLQKIQKAVEVGEINFATEKSLTELARTLETMRALALTSYQQSWQELQKTCRLDSLYNPGDLVWIPILTDSLPQLDPLFYNAQEREMETSHSQVRAKKAAYFPTLSAGYFQQEIDGIGGLNGWKIGASIPLWNRPTKVEVQTARIEALKTQQNLQYEIENMENELVNLLRLYRGLTGFMNRSATDFEEDMRKINRSLSEGNISMFEYAQLLQPMVQNQLKAIDLQLLFYQTLYQIEYLSK